MHSDISSQIHAGPVHAGATGGRLISQLFVVLGLLLVCRLGQHIPLPALTPTVIDSLFSSGGSVHLQGAVARLSPFALGLMPYISASICAQLVIWAFPGVAALTGTAQGRRRIGLYIRLFTVVMAVIQANSVATGIEQAFARRPQAIEMESWLFHLSIIASMTGSVMILVWLSDEITRRGLGDGVLLILFANFIADAPSAVAGALQVYQQGMLSDATLGALILVMAAAFVVTVAVESARRRIEVEPRGDGAGPQGAPFFLTLRLDLAGAAVPFMAATLSMLALIPFLLAAWALRTDGVEQFAALLGLGQPLHMAVYGISVVCVAYVLSLDAVETRRAAAMVEESGGSLPEAGPDESSQAYVEGVQRRLAAANAVYLAALCLLPEALARYFGAPFMYGGASLLIAVLVCLNVLRAFQHEAS